MSERQLTPNDPTLKKTALAADRIIGQLIPRNRSIDAEEFQKSVEYEKLTQEIYQGLLSKEPGGGTVEHNQNVRGRSGVEHQIDVLWRFKKAGVDHLVCVECCQRLKSAANEVAKFFASNTKEGCRYMQPSFVFDEIVS